MTGSRKKDDGKKEISRERKWRKNKPKDRRRKTVWKKEGKKEKKERKENRTEKKERRQNHHHCYHHHHHATTTTKTTTTILLPSPPQPVMSHSETGKIAYDKKKPPTHVAKASWKIHSSSAFTNERGSAFAWHHETMVWPQNAHITPLFQCDLREGLGPKWGKKERKHIPELLATVQNVFMTVSNIYVTTKTASPS